MVQVNNIEYSSIEKVPVEELLNCDYVEIVEYLTEEEIKQKYNIVWKY